MLTSEQLKKIRAEARPYIQRQMEDAKIVAGFRDVVTTAGGDWSALKALIKAEIQDEDDDSGEGKKIGKVVGKAEWTRIYADMLGLSNLNEKNSFAEDDDAELSGLEALDPDLLHMLIEGSKSEAGLAIIRNALAVVQGKSEPGNGAGAEADLHNPRNATASASHSAPTDSKRPEADGEAVDAAAAPAEGARPVSSATIQAEEASDYGAVGAADGVSNPGGDDVTSAEKVGAPISPIGGAAEGAGGVTHPSFVPARRQWQHGDPPHPLCKRPDGPRGCGGFSNLALCAECREAAGGQIVHSEPADLRVLN